MSRNYRSDICPLEIARELRASDSQLATITADTCSSSTETLLFKQKSRAHNLIV